MLVTAVLVGMLVLTLFVCHTTDAGLFEACWGVLFGIVLYAGAVLAVIYPFVRLFGLGEEDRDALFTAVFFGLPGLLVTLLVVRLIRGLLSR